MSNAGKLCQAVFVLFGLAISLAVGQWKEDGKVVPDRPWAKSAGDLGAKLVLTDKPDEFFAAWQKPGAVVATSEANVAKRGVPIVAVVIFTGCAADKRGLCDATVRYTAFKPDGAPYGNPQDGELWSGKPAPPRDQLQLSIGNMGIVIEPTDPLGVYKVRAEVYDKIAKRKLELERTFTAVEASKP
jgi:hypothetical protein